MNKKNIIFAEININEEDLNGDMRIINSFEEAKRLKKWKNKKVDYRMKMKKKLKKNAKLK